MFSARQVYATPDNDTYLMHHAHLGTSSLLIGQSDGRLVQVDLRSGEAVKHRLGDRGVRWVNVHPTREHTFVTAQKPRWAAPLSSAVFPCSLRG